MLWRALGHLSAGFWIDVGAADPYIDSVTHAFSRAGWRGINIEPRAAAIARFEAARPRDTNLHLAAGATAGRFTLYEVENGGLSTLDPEIAGHHRAAGLSVAEHDVEVIPLAEICRRHAPAEVHFLKIDVEGAERAVLEGADFQACRPWIVLVEATRPMSPQENSGEWEDLILAAGYRFAWFDGLNRFYIADEQWDALSPHFRVPPNVFDDFAIAGRLAAAPTVDRILAQTGAMPPPPDALSRAAGLLRRMVGRQ